MHQNFSLDNYNRIVIKTGSSLMCCSKTNSLREKWLDSFVSDVLNLISQKKEVILVCSGAIAIGSLLLNIDTNFAKSEEIRVCGSYGQTQLIKLIDQAFSKHNRKIAEVLITLDDSNDKTRFVNISNLTESLFSFNIIPVFNGNEAIYLDEIKFDSNDLLSARVAQTTFSDLLIMLSDINGLYTENPKDNSKAKHLSLIPEVTKEIENMSSGSTNALGTGGMKTKIEACKMSAQSGTDSIIANGKHNHPISNMLTNQNFSLFLAKKTRLSRKRLWLSQLIPKGTITVDDGAKSALHNRSSLLPIGILDVSGHFYKGDIVIIQDTNHNAFAKGIVEYSSDIIRDIMGNQSNNLTSHPEYQGKTEVMNRDFMLLLDKI